MNFHCPVENCDFGQNGGKSEQQVTSHITNKGDESHNSDDLTPRSNGGSNGGSDGGSDPSDDESEDSAAEIAEPAAEATTPPSDDPETPSEDDMPTDEEYQKQHGEIDEPAENDESDESNGGALSLPLPNLNTTTVIIVVGVLAVGVVAYLALRDDGGVEEVDEAAVLEESDDEDEQPVSNSEVTLLE